MSKLLKIVLVLVFIVTIFLIFNIFSSYQKQLSVEKGDDTVGVATTKYISKFDVYPNFLSAYLFNKYERDNLYLIQKNTPYPYLFILNILSELPKHSDDYKVDRVNEIEDELVCIGLSKDRVKTYQERILKLGGVNYLIDKYRKFDYESLLIHCNDRRG
ncbi:hypothetical protein [Acinetobacter sp. WCHAc060025]|uniref:hypothetical protein n=1 Tax=Acinetobacter sp. WCHAc060025 TaxID=2518625 RepID=UPI00102399D6|nr:hypothetical protein [Acinetobacter sp. WCHAc060025]RZG72913.1 hypothetical protein EXE09_16155 [Acinetobacter sp. WCHAc060025]